MNVLLAWFARNGVAANLLVALVVLGGLASLGSIRKQVFPNLGSDLLSVTVIYPGAAPADVESAICARLEERLYDLESVRRIRSVSAEGLGTVTLELEHGVPMSEALAEVKTRVDAIDAFPEDAEEPVIQEVRLRHRVSSVAISGPADEVTLKRLGERVRDDLTALDGVSQVELAASRPYEISVEVAEEALRRHGLTFDQVAEAVRRSSLDLPGGSIKTGGGEVLLRTQGQAYHRRDFEELTLLTRADGTRLLLGDAANVVDGFAEVDRSTSFDGHPAVLVQVYRTPDQDVTLIADRVATYVAQAQPRMPEGIRLTIWQDQTRILRGRLDTLLRNGRTGLLLVLLVLALFLKLRLAAWVALGIPVSFLGTLWLMPSLGLTINTVTLFAFLIVLGIVVDDAIVIGENIYRQLEAGKAGLEAAIAGVTEVATPVLFSVLTSIAAFAPLLSAPGNTGQVLRVISLVAITTLAFSLGESLLVLPSHLSHLRPLTAGRSPKARGRWRITDRFGSLLDRTLRKLYRPALERALVWRHTTVATAIAALLLTVGYVAGGHLKFSFFPPVEAESVLALVSLPRGAAAEATASAVGHIEESARELERELLAEGEAGAIRHTLASVGEQPMRGFQSSNNSGVSTRFAGSHLGEVSLELAAAEERSVNAADLARRWREITGPIPEAVELTFDSALFSPGATIDIQLAGDDRDSMRRAATAIKTALAGYPGVVDISDSLLSGKRELSLAITAEAQSLGLTLADLARQVRQGFYGEEVQRIQRGRDEVKVMVRYPRSERQSLASIEDMHIRTPAGGEIPFAVAGRLEQSRSWASIEHEGRQRTASVVAGVDPAIANSAEILDDLRRNVLPGILAEHPGLTFVFRGEQEQQAQTMGKLQRSLMLALFAIYALLAIPFRSYLQPLLVMGAIPFGIIGAIWGHVVMGHDLTAFSTFGIVAVTGVVINDSLVLVTFFNRARRTGASLTNAVRQGAVARFRPTLMTSATTFAGLTPLLLERSQQAQFLIPMAISIAFGVLFATVIVLFLVPASYCILHDLQSSATRLLKRTTVTG